MQDTALYQYLLGLQSPWTMSCVNLSVNGQRMNVWAWHRRMRRGHAHTTRHISNCTIIPRSGPGGIWTAVSFRRTCTQEFPV